MSTLPRERAEAVHPSPTLALVPTTGDADAAVAPPRKEAAVAFVIFFAIGYMGCGLVLLSGWLGAVSVDAQNALAVAAVMLILMAGPGALAHALKRRNPRKMLGGLAVLVAVTSVEPLVGRVAEEVYAGRMIPALQPLADDVAGYEGIERLEISARTGWVASDPWVNLNGVQGRYGGRNLPHTAELVEEMRRVGVTPAAMAVLDRRMREGRVALVEARDGHLTFRRTGVERWRLLYVTPGHVLPARAVGSRGRGTEPLGGGWYLVR